MTSQWDYFLKNLGQWQGSFTSLSPLGEVREDVKSILTLEGFNNNSTVRLVLQRFPPNQPPHELKLEFTSLSRSLLFCETGAFSQGSMQWSPFSDFGAELSLIDQDRRLRLVQLFNTQGKFNQLTLIREKLAGTYPPEKPDLTLEQLLGKWVGEAITISPDWYSSEPFPTELLIERTTDNRILQQLTWGKGDQRRTMSSSAIIDGSRLLFDQSNLPVQILLLPDGASSNCPLEIKLGHSFVLEVGWLIAPTRRQRLIRRYNEKGEWVSLTLVKEEKTA
ncbi:DUF3598 family protein [Gloeothece verrucosa]|uniref:Uncharacterized protein n=1 Tax=Gloeothece verrucosa (strain PCC 7822) TaxID=497965 RepID=E0U9P5_GLOV7|nr:DUF3598 family protein [Gloeothece verrucosa]ADN13846.1 conserved hypothetical protein [Gloeothece verrucosa PCC 7822]